MSDKPLSDLEARIAALTPSQREALFRKMGQGQPSTAQPTGIVPRAPGSHPPLSFSQHGFWLLDQLQPGKIAYNSWSTFRFAGRLDVKALKQSMSELVARHEGLRTTFAVVGGQPVQTIASTVEVPLVIVDLSGSAAASRTSLLHELLAKDAGTPFHLDRAPLVRLTLVKLEEQEHVLGITVPHIISDGRSMEVLIEDLVAAYRLFSTGVQPAPAAAAVQYADYALWQRAQVPAVELERQVSYWKKQLAGASPTLDLPTDRPRSAIQSWSVAHHLQVLSPTLTLAINELSLASGGSVFMTLLAALDVVLSRWSGQSDIVVGTPFSLRSRTEVERVFGCFINFLALRVDCSANPTFRELLRRAKEVCLEAFSHQELPFSRLVSELKGEQDRHRTPVFQVVLNMLGKFGEYRAELPGLVIESLVVDELDAQAKFDLTVYISTRGDRLSLDMVYSAELFDAARIAELGAQLEQLLLLVTGDPDQPVASHSLVTPSTVSRLPDRRQPLPVAWEGSLAAKVASHAQQRPTAIAAVDAKGTLTYERLDRLSTALAGKLQAAGAAGKVVAIWAERSNSVVWPMLGVLKAKGAMLMLDPAYPPARLVEMLRAAAPCAFVEVADAPAVPESLKAFLDGELKVPRFRADPGAVEATPSVAAAALGEVAPDDLAYLGFTSGSTGGPKGVLGTHRPLSHFFAWYQQTFAFTSTDRFSALSGLSHDPFLRDVLLPLWVGATVHFPDPAQFDQPQNLRDWFVRQGITVTHLTPAMAWVLVADHQGPGTLTSLKLAGFGGDMLSGRDLQRVRALAPAVRCINFYGATETPQVMGWYEPGPESEGAGAIAVGRGIDAVQLLVLDEARALRAVGEVGEIGIRTPYLTRGYLNDERRTSERFIANAATGVGGDRIYLTGDLGRYRPDGVVEVCGRADNQVKIRGFRIELAEVEAALAQQPTVKDVVVAVREETPGDKRLVAYLVPRAGAEPKSAELRAALKERLPEYMVPAFFMTLSALPLTPNGKVDRKALPTPEWGAERKAYVAPRTPAEQTLAAHWAQVLDLEQVGIHDNFFELGGNSLMAIQLVVLANEADLPLTPPMIFIHQTIAELVAGLAE